MRVPKMDPWHRVLKSAAGAVDRAMIATINAYSARDRARVGSLAYAERLALLEEVAAHYAGAFELPDHGYFPTPSAPSMQLRPVRDGVWDAAWPSTFTPFHAGTADAYMANVENRTARARLFFGPKGKARPAVIAIHGYMGGQWLLEEAAWPLTWLLRRGLDVALPVLPFHAARGGERRGAPPFPGSDPYLTNEGFRQAVGDVRALAIHLRDRGAPVVGVMGMSLGGYTSALVATVSREIDFVMPMIPLASIADFAREQGRLGGGDEALALHAALERANGIVSPVARPSLVPPHRALVIAAEHDRVTPVAHAGRIARHLGCATVTIPGGHLLQIGRAEAFRALAGMLEREGIVRPAPRRG